MSKTIDKKIFYSKFKEEAREHIEKLNSGLLALEANPDDFEVLDEILREAHTLKGAAGIVELADISKIVHKIEDVFISIKEKKLKLNDKMLRVLFFGLDSVLLLVETQSEEQESGVDIQKVCESLEQIYVLEKAGGKKKAAEKSTLTIVPKTFKKTDETIKVDAVKFDKLMNLVGEIVIDQIRSHGAIVILRKLVNLTREQWGVFKQVKRKIIDEIGESGSGAEELGAKIMFMENLCNQLKTDTYKLWRDQSELISHRDLIINGLQQEVMDARMLPIATIFNTFPRLVFDLSKEQEKKIKLNMEGLETELDKKMIEEIRDPLMHLVRNAVDHGIESPETRLATGKPAEGIIDLLATQEGESIVVKIKDDGAGVDLEKIKEIAIKKNHITSSEINSASRQELVNLLFRPGFSTSEEITNISGRGVGLDVVKRNIEELKGTVDLYSDSGKGTTVTLKIPLTLAIIRVLLVKVGEDIFALPTSSIEETIRIYADDIRKIEGEDAIDLRGTIIPVVDLANILNVSRVDGEGVFKEGRASAVIVSSAGRRIGFIVDELVGEQSVVVKTLGGYLKNIGNIAGATVLDKGEVVIILHIPDLIKLACFSTETEKETLKTQFKDSEIGRKKLVLVVEDSSITRELEKDILQTLGYEVETASDGIDAVSRLAERSFDLIITDIQMPRMDGFQLVEYIRKEENYKNIPAIIVSSREEEEDIKRGVEVGADAYILKSSFNQADLHETIKRLTG
ncbi:MAG: response regulator [Actinobacteria bacterium]|nr:response regulator [Actinomycetota bacterium]